jgi:hypothetical protein
LSTSGLFLTTINFHPPFLFKANTQQRLIKNESFLFFFFVLVKTLERNKPKKREKENKPYIRQDLKKTLVVARSKNTLELIVIMKIYNMKLVVL